MNMTTEVATSDKVRYEETRIGNDHVFLGYIPGNTEAVARVDVPENATDEEKNEAFTRLVDMVVDHLSASKR